MFLCNMVHFVLDKVNASSSSNYKFVGAEADELYKPLKYDFIPN